MSLSYKPVRCGQLGLCNFCRSIDLGYRPACGLKRGFLHRAVQPEERLAGFHFIIYANEHFGNPADSLGQNGTVRYISGPPWSRDGSKTSV